MNGAAVVIDRDGCITMWSDAAGRLLGQPAREVLGARWDSLALPPTVELTDVPLEAEDGSPAGMLRILRGRRSAPAQPSSDRRLAAIIDNSDDAIVSKTLDGIVMSWNRAAEHMFGYTAAEMIGRSIRTIIPADRQGEEDEVLARLRRGEKIDHFDTIRQRKDGTPVPISLTVSPIRDDQGRVIGASKIARDISERKTAEAERARIQAIAERNAAITTSLNRVGAIVAATLDPDAVVRAVTDAVTELTEAQFAGFDPTFGGDAVVRSEDITADLRYHDHPPFCGDRPADARVRSYLEVPVKAPNGSVIGGLFFGHEEAGRFTEEHEELVSGVAAWASVALENARLYRSLQDASRLKDEFLATLSHELRTPLNAILGYARMMRTGLLGMERQPRAIDTIERNAASLAQIVEDVLDVSRIVAGKMRLNVQTVDPIDVIKHAVDALKPTADLKRIDVQTILDPRAGPVAGDPDRLQQIVWNLLSNAIKFTDRGGRVQLRLERIDSSVAIVISDTGIGITPAFLPHVFERFRQEDAGASRTTGGLGLGLAIVHQLVELHGGTITAESKGAGKGATFRVTLPIMLATSLSAASGESIGAAAAPPALPDLTGIRVLAIDDDADALAMVRDILEARGAELTTASSADAALEALAVSHPDVVVADLGLPHVDGFALIQRIRRHENPAIARVPAAALTAFARSEDRRRALRAGFQMHLAKPIDPAELLESVLALSRSRSRTAS